MKKEIPQTVIVALEDQENGFSCDAELPSDMPAGELRTGLLRLLRSCEPRYYAGCDYLALNFNGLTIEEGQTLASVGAWEGSHLRILTAKTGRNSSVPPK